MRQHRIPFNRTRDTEIRWTLNRETGLFTILSDTENGHVNTYRWYIIEMISENVWVIQPSKYHGTSQYKKRCGESTLQKTWRFVNGATAWRETRARALIQLTVQQFSANEMRIDMVTRFR